MYRLLIVDDEPFIVDWIYELFSQQRMELDIYKAYSAPEALSLLKRARIDIVLTDISMPDMDGLALLKEIQENWPYCRVIFLTAHHEFDYARIASKSGVTYLLKTESDTEIIRAVERAIGEIRGQMEQEALLVAAKKQRERTLPILQRDYLMDCLQGRLEEAVTQPALDDLEVRLTAADPVFLLMGTIDRWHAPGERGARVRRVTALEAFMLQYLSPLARFVSLPVEDGMHIWLLQPQKYQEFGEDVHALQDRMIVYVKGSLDTIQEQMSRSLGTTCSFVLDAGFCLWDALPRHFSRMLLKMNYGGMDENVIETVPAPDHPEDAAAESHLQALQQVGAARDQIRRLESFLESGQKEACVVELARLRELALAVAKVYEGLGIEVVQALLLMFLAFMNRQESQADHHALREQVQNLIVMHGTRTYDELFHSLEQVVDRIVDRRNMMRVQREKSLVERLHAYIESHLHEDVSLIRLAEQVYLNPAYLSRLYKLTTGQNLSDHILSLRLEKSKDMLKTEGVRIHQIAVDVGFESAAYFTRVFKKHMGMTPQEYRDRVLKR